MAGFTSQTEVLTSNELTREAPEYHHHLIYDVRYGCSAGHTWRGPEMQMCPECGDAWWGRFKEHP